MSTTFQSINRFAVLNNVEPGSSSSSRSSKNASGIQAAVGLESSTTKNDGAISKKKKNKLVNGKITGQPNGSITVKSNKPGGPSLTDKLSNPIRTSPPTTLKSPTLQTRQDDPTQPKVLNTPPQPPNPIIKKTDWEIPRKTLHASIGESPHPSTTLAHSTSPPLKHLSRT